MQVRSTSTPVPTSAPAPAPARTVNAPATPIEEASAAPLPPPPPVPETQTPPSRPTGSRRSSRRQSRTLSSEILAAELAREFTEDRHPEEIVVFDDDADAMNAASVEPVLTQNSATTETTNETKSSFFERMRRRSRSLTRNVTRPTSVMLMDEKTEDRATTASRSRSRPRSLVLLGGRSEASKKEAKRPVEIEALPAIPSMSRDVTTSPNKTRTEAWEHADALPRLSEGNEDGNGRLGVLPSPSTFVFSEHQVSPTHPRKDSLAARLAERGDIFADDVEPSGPTDKTSPRRSLGAESITRGAVLSVAAFAEQPPVADPGKQISGVPAETVKVVQHEPAPSAEDERDSMVAAADVAPRTEEDPIIAAETITDNAQDSVAEESSPRTKLERRLSDLTTLPSQLKALAPAPTPYWEKPGAARRAHLDDSGTSEEELVSAPAVPKDLPLATETTPLPIGSEADGEAEVTTLPSLAGSTRTAQDHEPAAASVLSPLEKDAVSGAKRDTSLQQAQVNIAQTPSEQDVPDVERGEATAVPAVPHRMPVIASLNAQRHADVPSIEQHNHDQMLTDAVVPVAMAAASVDHQDKLQQVPDDVNEDKRSIVSAQDQPVVAQADRGSIRSQRSAVSSIEKSDAPGATAAVEEPRQTFTVPPLALTQQSPSTGLGQGDVSTAATAHDHKIQPSTAAPLSLASQSSVSLPIATSDVEPRGHAPMVAPLAFAQRQTIRPVLASPTASYSTVFRALDELDLSPILQTSEPIYDEHTNDKYRATHHPTRISDVHEPGTGSQPALNRISQRDASEQPHFGTPDNSEALQPTERRRRRSSGALLNSVLQNARGNREARREPRPMSYSPLPRDSTGVPVPETIDRADPERAAERQRRRSSGIILSAVLQNAVAGPSHIHPLFRDRSREAVPVLNGVEARDRRSSKPVMTTSAFPSSSQIDDQYGLEDAPETTIVDDLVVNDGPEPSGKRKSGMWQTLRRLSSGQPLEVSEAAPAVPPKSQRRSLDFLTRASESDARPKTLKKPERSVSAAVDSDNRKRRFSGFGALFIRSPPSSPAPTPSKKLVKKTRPPVEPPVEIEHPAQGYYRQPPAHTHSQDVERRQSSAVANYQDYEAARRQSAQYAVQPPQPTRTAPPPANQPHENYAPTNGVTLLRVNGSQAHRHSLQDEWYWNEQMSIVPDAFRPVNASYGVIDSVGPPPPQKRPTNPPVYTETQQRKNWPLRGDSLRYERQQAQNSVQENSSSDKALSRDIRSAPRSSSGQARYQSSEPAHDPTLQVAMPAYGTIEAQQFSRDHDEARSPAREYADQQTPWNISLPTNNSGRSLPAHARTVDNYSALPTFDANQQYDPRMSSRFRNQYYTVYDPQMRGSSYPGQEWMPSIHGYS